MARQHEIRIKVNEDEFNIIKRNAEKLKMTVANYIRMAAENPNIIEWNYSAIQEHTAQVGRIVDSINMLVFTIELQNNYQPKEIEGIYEYIKQIFESENKLLETVRNQWIEEFKERKKGW